VGFYHFLASLFTAGVLVWIAEILRRRFGLAGVSRIPDSDRARTDVPGAGAESLLGGGTWFVPMAIAMLLADEENPARRLYLICRGLSRLCG